MDENYVINIFLPTYVIGRSRHVLFGIVENFPNYTIVNCVGSHNLDQRDSVAKISGLCSQVVKGFGHLDGRYLSIIGCISDVSDRHRAFNLPGEIDCFSEDVYFVLYVDLESRKFDVENVVLGNRSLDAKQTRIIFYDVRDLLTSRLILRVKESGDNETLVPGEKTSFAKFLRCTTTAAAHITGLPDDETAKSSSQQFGDNVLYCFPVLLYKMFVFLALQYEYCYAFCGARVPRAVLYLTQLSSVGEHVRKRLHHVHQITRSIIKEKTLPLSSGNLISAIAFDVLCGWIFTYLLWQCCPPSFLLEIFLKYTNIVVDHLQLILHWLMGAPAGLKLNIPLNRALGNFFLYHIFLWETYMADIKPILAFVLQCAAVLGTLGLTFIVGLLNDLLSLATIHIYCFYGYAAKLYCCQITGITSLWRLFRGKKWNPLRQRIDSYSYDVQRLHVGTLFFTVLTFLLPTVMAYYIVFTALRLVVLVVQGIITRIINLFSIFPVYVIVLRAFNSKLTTGDVYFSVVQEQKALVLSMELVQIPLQSVIQRTAPEDVFKRIPLSWKGLWDSLVWGKIIYPM